MTQSTTTVTELIHDSVFLLIDKTADLDRSPKLFLYGSQHIKQGFEYDVVFDVVKNKDGYYNIMYEGSIIGGLKQKNNGRITGKINLSSVSGFNTCVITQLSHVKDKLLLQPIGDLTSKDYGSSKFITKDKFIEMKNT